MKWIDNYRSNRHHRQIAEAHYEEDHPNPVLVVLAVVMYVAILWMLMAAF